MLPLAATFTQTPLPFTPGASYDTTAVVLPTLPLTLTPTRPLPPCPSRTSTTMLLSDSHTLARPLLMPTRTPTLLSTAPNPDPPTLSHNPPLLAAFPGATVDEVGASKLTHMLALPTPANTLTATPAPPPPPPRTPAQATLVPDVHTDRLQPLTPTRTPAL